MLTRPLALAGALLAGLAATSAISTAARADDVHLADSTVFVMSTGDWKAMKTAIDASDMGRFLADPEIRRIGQTLKTGISGLIQKGIEEASHSAGEATDGAAMKEKMHGLLALGKDYCTSLCEDMSGRVSFSIGMMMDPEQGEPQPNIICEFGGTDRVHAMHEQLIGNIITMSEGKATRTHFSSGGYDFSGIEEEGLGLFFGRKGDRFLLGVHHAGIVDYLDAVAGSTVRLGNVPFYKSATAATGRGQLSSFVNLTPVWQIAMGLIAMMPVSEGDPNPAAVIQALGLTDLQGMASTVTWSPKGVSNKTFVGMVGRRGLLRLVPTENKALAPPPFAPTSVLSANTLRLELAQIMNVVRDILALAPPEEIAEFNAGLAQASGMFGFTVDELLSDLEGSVFYASPAGAAAMNPMAMMMGGGMGLDLSFGIKLVSKERFQKLLATMLNPELTQGMLTKQEVSGREVWSMMVPAGPAAMQLAVAFEGDWLIFATGTETLKKAFSRVDSGENLSGNTAYGSLIEMVGGSSGMMLSYTDSGKSTAQMLEMIRPMLGMIPLFVPDVQQNPELLFFFDPANLPSGATIEKYFGTTVTRGRVADGGILIDGWTPTVSAPKKEEEAEKKAGF